MTALVARLEQQAVAEMIACDVGDGCTERSAHPGRIENERVVGMVENLCTLGSVAVLGSETVRVVVAIEEGVVDVINEDTERGNDANCKANDGLADYGNDSGGDVRCGDPAVINHQHNPQYLGPGAILVADSDNDRVVELHERNGSWEVAWGVDSANGVRFDWPRDADRLPNGNTLITDSRNNRIVEVTPDGETVWSTETGIWPYDAERLPYNELLGDDRLPRMNGTGDAPGVSENTLPLLERAHSGLSYVVSLPVWFQPWHTGAVILGGLLALVGGVLVWSGRRG